MDRDTVQPRKVDHDAIFAEVIRLAETVGPVRDEESDILLIAELDLIGSAFSSATGSNGGWTHRFRCVVLVAHCHHKSRLRSPII